MKSKQIKLDDCNSETHKWSNWFSTPHGLTRECKKCRKVETGKFYEGKFLLNPPLDADGFLDADKLKEIKKIEGEAVFK